MPTLYRQVTLLDCQDAEALQEIVAGLPSRLVVWPISETVVALDTEAVEEILTILRRRGVIPREVRA